MNVQELLERAGIQPKKVSNTKGGEYHSPCPGCGGEDRFHVWPEQNNGKGSYWCRGCDKGGDNIQFLIDFENLSFAEACQQLGRTLPESMTLKTPTCPRRNKKAFEPSVYSDPDNTWRIKAAKFVSWAHNHLMQLPDQLAWLAQRGISAETAKWFQLGWNPGEKEKDIFRPREAWGLTPETKENGKPRRLWIPIGLVIPHFTAGNVTRIRIRRPDSNAFGPRYYVLPGSSMATMRIKSATDGGDRFSWSAYVVVEAELDAVAVWQAAGKASGVVAIGSAQTKPDQETFRVLDNCNIILNALDFDEAGAKAQPWWAETFPHSERWPVPEGKDPGEAYEAGVDLRTWVLAGLPNFDSDRRQTSPEASGEKQKAPAYDDDAVLSNLVRSVAELYELLKTSPARIKKAGDNIHAEINKEWEKKNWTASKRISDLVFMDPDVGQYLNLHPASNITAKNFLSIAVILKLDGKVTT